MYLHYIIDKDDFDLAGEASSKVKKALTQLGINPVTIKKAAISMYEAEINAFIHGGGGDAFVDIDKDRIKIVIEDHGNGIEDLSLAMQEGFSTASEFIRQLGFGAGMGLPNMKKHTDELIIETQAGIGTTVTMILNITN